MFDAKIIKVYQWIVDESQKKPGWWAENVIFANVALNIVSIVLQWKGTPWNYFWVFIFLSIGALFVMDARDEARLRRQGESLFIRALMFGCMVASIAKLIMMPTAMHVLDLLITFTFSSFYYFAACENPRPKKRKEKLVLSTT